MTGRRLFPLQLIGALAAGAFQSDDRPQITEWLARWAGYLTGEDPDSFLRALDRTLRDHLEANVHAIVRNNEVASSIDVLKLEPEGEHRNVELDWYLELRSRAIATQTARRRQRVKLKLQRSGKGWKVIHLEPLSHFAP